MNAPPPSQQPSDTSPPAMLDDDDDFHDNPSSHASDLMTASYSEISFHGLIGGTHHSTAPTRPASLVYGRGDHTAEPPARRSAAAAATSNSLRDGPVTSFVAEDLVDQIKLASPVQRTGSAAGLPTAAAADDDATTPHVPRQFLQQSQVSAKQ